MLKSFFPFLLLSIVTGFSYAQLTGCQMIEDPDYNGPSNPSYPIIFVNGTITPFYNQNVSIHHTSTPDSHIAYFGMDYTDEQMVGLFGTPIEKEIHN